VLGHILWHGLVQLIDQDSQQLLHSLLWQLLATVSHAIQHIADVLRIGLCTLGHECRHQLLLQRGLMLLPHWLWRFAQRIHHIGQVAGAVSCCKLQVALHAHSIWLWLLHSQLGQLHDRCCQIDGAHAVNVLIYQRCQLLCCAAHDVCSDLFADPHMQLQTADRNHPSESWSVLLLLLLLLCGQLQGCVRRVNNCMRQAVH
jgi:hypothetical protein